MKILEAQAATLTNYEVWQHLTHREEVWKHKSYKGLPSGPLRTISREMISYLEEAPSPLGAKPFPYNERTITNLLTALRQWDFTKAEIIMILNLRPTKPEALNTIVEQMEDRFPGDELQFEICRVIGEVLGRPDGQAERQAMTDNAAVARKELEEKPEELMEIDDD